MDGVFSLPEATRTDFLRSLMQSFGCAYICLWQSYDSHLSNRLFFLDGLYNVTNNQSSSSLGSISVAAESLFNLYQRLTFDVNDDCVPGLAFRNHMPYLELQQLDLLRMASTAIQKQFFQEARIETAIFMGCSKGEIELGFSTISQIDIQTALGSLFPEDFHILSQPPIDQNPPSATSSSWIPLSTGSRTPECSSFLFSIPGTTMQQPPIQGLNQDIPSHVPTPEGEHDAIIRALVDVISPPSSSTTHQHQPHQNLSHTSVTHPEASAFKIYRPDTGPRPNTTPQMGSNSRRQSLMKRSIASSRSLHLKRMRQRIQSSRPTTSQLHHTISERRRREKLNESFQALRALLPPETKKDKASILAAAKKTLSSMMAEIEKLNQRNQQRLNERLNVWVSHVPESSSSEERMVQVTVRGESSQDDMVIRLVEFLKRVQNVSLISMGANTSVTEGAAINQINFRLRIVELKGRSSEGAMVIVKVVRCAEFVTFCGYDPNYIQSTIQNEDSSLAAINQE